MKTSSTVRPVAQFLATACDNEYQLLITGTGSQQECELMRELYSRGLELAVKEMNREISIQRITKQKQGRGLSEAS